MDVWFGNARLSILTHRLRRSPSPIWERIFFFSIRSATSPFGIAQNDNYYVESTSDIIKRKDLIIRHSLFKFLIYNFGPKRLEIVEEPFHKLFDSLFYWSGRLVSQILS